MGGRGTFANKNNVPYIYREVGEIGGVKVLEGINGNHSLPEEAHSSFAYIKLKPDGTFHEMRIYDKNHFLIQEIAYHPEPNLNGGNRTENILHIHEYKPGDFENRKTRLMTQDEINRYKKYLRGVKI